MKKLMAGATIAASMVGLSAAAAPQALAVGDSHGPASVNGNGARQGFGDAVTHGRWSPQTQLVQGTLNKLCLGIPAKVNVGSVVGLVNVAVQDINVLSNPQNQQCADNSTQLKGDETLSHIVDNIPVLSGNGAGNH